MHCNPKLYKTRVYLCFCGVICALLILAGCATPPAPPPDDSQELWRQKLWNAHRAAVAGLSAWQIKGKISVQITRGGKPKNGNATWRLKHRPQQQQIEIYGPFGGGRVHMHITPGQTVLRDTKGARITAATAAEALYEKLGWRLPVAKLQYWLRGLPDPESRADASLADFGLDRRGRLRSLTQGEWRVDYLRYQHIAGLQLPHTLELRGMDGTQAVRVKIVLKRWRGLEFD